MFSFERKAPNEWASDEYKQSQVVRNAVQGFGITGFDAGVRSLGLSGYRAER